MEIELPVNPYDRKDELHVKVGFQVGSKITRASVCQQVLEKGRLEQLQLWIYGLVLTSTEYQESKKWIMALQELIEALKQAQEAQNAQNHKAGTG